MSKDILQVLKVDERVHIVTKFDDVVVARGRWYGVNAKGEAGIFVIKNGKKVYESYELLECYVKRVSKVKLKNGRVETSRIRSLIKKYGNVCVKVMTTSACTFNQMKRDGVEEVVSFNPKFLSVVKEDEKKDELTLVKI